MATLKKTKFGFQGQLLLNAGQEYCRMLPQHSAIISTFIKLPFVIKNDVLSFFEWPLKTGFTVPTQTVFVEGILFSCCPIRNILFPQYPEEP